MKTAVILNPRSAHGRAGRAWPRLEPAVRQALGLFTLLETERSGHASELARNALKQGHDRIVSVGGDGTHHEVVNGFFDDLVPVNPDATLALLPLGTGSDLARTLGLPKGLDAAPLLALTSTIGADVGRATFTLSDGTRASEYFINVSHVGAGGAVAERVNRTTKVLGGFPSFLWGVLATLLTYQNVSLRLDIDGQKLSQVCNDIVIANGRYDGGGMLVAPEARLDSGHFEVYVIGDIGRIESFTNLPKIYKGRLMDRPDKVTHFKAKRIVVEADAPVCVNLDGECPGHLPAIFEVLSAAVRLVCP